jgi:6-phosphofructokinase 2
MKTPTIATLTLNPSLDKSASFNGLIAEQKMRCSNPQYDSGGGGINVSKAIARLGGTSLCIYTAGGSAGGMLQSLIEKEGISSKVITTKSWTRENFVALDTSTNAQYRFGFPGNALLDEEKQAIQDAIANNPTDYLVISGSINQGLETDFYKKIAVLAKANGTKVVVDTAGEALQKVLETGVYLIKPNLGELAKLLGVERLEQTEVEKACQALLHQGAAEVIVVSLGPAGAMLVTKTQTEWIAAPSVAKKSTVGAGDSMVGGMVWALAQNKPWKEVLQWGVACGTAATMNEGTQLFKKEDVERLFQGMKGGGITI